MAAPVTVIVAYDMAFYEKMPYLFPHTDAKSWFDSKPRSRRCETIALRNGSLQGAYLMLAARALGLDCGPMSGFDNAKVDAAFFAGTTLQVQLPGQPRPRRSRPSCSRVRRAWPSTKPRASPEALNASTALFAPPPTPPPRSSTMFKRIASRRRLSLSPAPCRASPRRCLQDRPQPHQRDRQLEPFRLLQSDRATSARSTAASSTTPTTSARRRSR